MASLGFEDLGAGGFRVSDEQREREAGLTGAGGGAGGGRNVGEGFDEVGLWKDWGGERAGQGMNDGQRAIGADQSSSAIDQLALAVALEESNRVEEERRRREVTIALDQQRQQQEQQRTINFLAGVPPTYDFRGALLFPPLPTPLASQGVINGNRENERSGGNQFQQQPPIASTSATPLLPSFNGKSPSSSFVIPVAG